MLYAGLDIHKAVFQAVVLDPESGELRETRFAPSRETLRDWAHEGWPCSRGRLLSSEGQRWLAALELDPHARAQVDVIVAVMAALQEQIELVESELRRFARADRRCRALQTIFGVGPILACHLLAEIGEARRFQRPRQLVRASGLDPSVIESAESKRRGRL